MKKLFTRKRFLATAAVSLLAVIAVGFSYAAFTYTVPTEAKELDMGTLKVALVPSDGNSDYDDFYFEPNQEFDLSYTFKNIGNLSAYAEISLDGKVMIRSGVDSYGNAYPLDTPFERDIDTDVISIKLDEDALPNVSTEDGTLLWFKDTLTGKYYVWIDPNLFGDMGINVAFDKKMGNEYQNATISLADQIKATQTDAEIIYDMFGLNDAYMRANFVGIGAPLNAGSGRSMTVNTVELLIAKLAHK